MFIISALLKGMNHAELHWGLLNQIMEKKNIIFFYI